jgi:hypothetical protein
VSGRYPDANARIVILIPVTGTIAIAVTGTIVRFPVAVTGVISVARSITLSVARSNTHTAADIISQPIDHATRVGSSVPIVRSKTDPESLTIHLRTSDSASIGALMCAALDGSSSFAYSLATDALSARSPP